MDAYYNYQTQQTYGFLHSFRERCYSSNFHLKQIVFELNVNLLNFFHLQFRTAAAQYAPRRQRD